MERNRFEHFLEVTLNFIERCARDHLLTVEMLLFGYDIFAYAMNNGFVRHYDLFEGVIPSQTGRSFSFNLSLSIALLHFLCFCLFHLSSQNAKCMLNLPLAWIYESKSSVINISLCLRSIQLVPRSFCSTFSMDLIGCGRPSGEFVRSYQSH